MDRDELHELVSLLKTEIEAGRVKVNDIRTIRSLERVQIASDGKIDPATVDGVVRSFAMAVGIGQARRAMRRVPLRDVQSNYFDILDQSFGQLFDRMRSLGLNPHQIAQHLSSDDEVLQAFNADVIEFAPALREFWDEFGPVVEVHLGDLQCLKSVFGGDIFPSYATNIACSAGLYMDTIVLTDPLLRLADFIGKMNPQHLFYFATKHALNALSYRKLALAEVSPPIVVIAPDPSYADRSYMMTLQVAGEATLLEHACRMFGRTFATAEDFRDFLTAFKSANELISALSDPQRLLFEVGWSEPLSEQLQRNQREISTGVDATVSQGGIGVGGAVFVALLGRMIQANEALVRSSRYGGTPLVDAPTSWRYLQWTYEYDGMTKPSDAAEVLISKAVESEGSKEFGLLSALPAEALIQLRQEGALAELRDVIRRGIKEMDVASPTAVSAVSDSVIANIDAAFSEHDRLMREIATSNRRFFGLDVGRWMAFGGISLAAASTGNAGLAVLAAAAGMVGAPSMPELWRRYQEMRLKRETLHRSPTGILFRHLGKRFGF